MEDSATYETPVIWRKFGANCRHCCNHPVWAEYTCRRRRVRPVSVTGGSCHNPRAGADRSIAAPDASEFKGKSFVRQLAIRMRVKPFVPSGPRRVAMQQNEQSYELICLGTSVPQTIEGDTKGSWQLPSTLACRGKQHVSLRPSSRSSGSAAEGVYPRHRPFHQRHPAGCRQRQGGASCLGPHKEPIDIAIQDLVFAD